MSRWGLRVLRGTPDRSRVDVAGLAGGLRRKPQAQVGARASPETTLVASAHAASQRATASGRQEFGMASGPGDWPGPMPAGTGSFRCEENKILKNQETCYKIQLVIPK